MPFSDILQYHIGRYPAMTTLDALFLAYQNEFGVSQRAQADNESSYRLLCQEYDYFMVREGIKEDADLFESIGNGFCRCNLNAPAFDKKMLPALTDMFCRISADRLGSTDSLFTKMEELSLLGKSGLLHMTEKDEIALMNYRLAGCPVPRHSKTYWRRYHPHYRVISELQAEFFDPLDAIGALVSAGEPCLVAIDGRCLAGKTTLARLAGELYGCSVFHMDDYFLPLSRRSPERMAKSGGNIDHERLIEEIIMPHCKRQYPVSRRYDCHTDTLSRRASIEYTPVAIIEGTYSLMREIRGYIGYSIFLDIDEQSQYRRLIAREKVGGAEAFLAKWIPMEEKYFASGDIDSFADMIIDCGDTH